MNERGAIDRSPFVFFAAVDGPAFSRYVGRAAVFASPKCLKMPVFDAERPQKHLISLISGIYKQTDGIVQYFTSKLSELIAIFQG